MKRISVLAAGVCAAVLVAAGPAPKSSSTSPIATYWMDVSTQSGMGAGMMGGGGRPNLGQVMAMMNGGGGGAAHMLDLRLASRTAPAGPPQAAHWIPPGLQMGASLPLLTPVREVARPERSDGMPSGFQRPRGRMLIYWGCGDHVGAGQPMVIDFSKIAAGQMPPGMAAMASMAHTIAGPTSAPGFGRWPNERDSRQVPATGSLVGAHRVEGNYSPPIAFSLGGGQDFMAPLGLREAGNRLIWNPVPTATGYALSLFGANGGGDVVMWSSANKAQMPAMDYLAPAEVRRLIAAGSVLAPTVTQCTLPAEVAAAAPPGMVMGIGYGPEADFSDNPRTPKWGAKVRFKTTASMMHGMGAMMRGEYGDNGDGQPQPPPAPKKRRGIGLGDILGAIPH